MPKKIRRVVTGHDAKGKAVVLMDGAAPNAKVRPGTGLVSTLLWVTDTAPAKLSDKDTADREIGITPPINGTILRILEMPAGANRTPEQTAAIRAARHTEATVTPQTGLQHDLTSRHPGMHRTESVDYALVLSGEVTMLLDDDSETHLKTGDVVIMQGTYHAWANRGDQPCMIAFILVGAEVPWKK